MARCLSIEHAEKASRKGRKYCRLREMLPTEDERVRFSSHFTIQNQTWKYSAHVNSDSLSIIIYCIHDIQVTNHYYVLAGIFRESGEEIAISNAEATARGLFIVQELISRQTLDSILQSNELFTFFVEIERKDLEKERKEKVLKKKHQTDYKDLLLSGAQSDLIIHVKDSKFTCHTLILGARSPVFKSMIQHETQEKRSGEMTLSDADPAIFQEFLFYLYTGSEEHLNWENIMELYKLAHKYCVEDLKYVCVERMRTSVTTENFFEVFLLSQQYGESELFEAKTMIFLESFEDIIESEKWMEFMKTYPDEAFDMLQALAESYGVELMKTCISTENFFEIFLLSQKDSDSELSKAAIAFFLENSGVIIESKQWIEFMKEFPNAAHVLFKSLAESYRLDVRFRRLNIEDHGIKGPGASQDLLSAYSA